MIIKRKEGSEDVLYFSTKSEAHKAAREVKVAIKAKRPWTKWKRFLGTDGVMRWGIMVKGYDGLFAVSVIMSGSDCGIADRLIPCDGSVDEVVKSCLLSRKADVDAGVIWWDDM
jgi:hypothetical protein